MLHASLSHVVSTYGYWAIAGVIGLESIGVPLPGEAMLITGAIYAGTTRRLDIRFIIAVAAAGAIIGDNIGFCLGRELGYRLVLRYGRFVGLTEHRIKLGRYLFLCHGGKVVFCGRFVSILRAFAAILAGVNRMRWSRFLLANATGSVAWASAYGSGAYYLGEEVERLAKPIGIAIGVLALGTIASMLIILRRHELRLGEKAERAFPGQLHRLVRNK